MQRIKGKKKKKGWLGGVGSSPSVITSVEIQRGNSVGLHIPGNNVPQCKLNNIMTKATNSSSSKLGGGSEKASL